MYTAMKNRRSLFAVGYELIEAHVGLVVDLQKRFGRFLA